MYTIFLVCLHLLAAILATWRITELFTQDRITSRLRAKFPTYLWQCPRCMSVWAGIWATLILVVFPWANWPFALAWIYLAHLDRAFVRKSAREGRTFEARAKDNRLEVTRNELERQELLTVFRLILDASPAPRIVYSPPDAPATKAQS